MCSASRQPCTCIDRSSRPPNAPPTPGQLEPDLLGPQPEGRADLALVDVQPLGGDVEVDAADAVGDGEPGLGAEERLVLHADLVVAGDDDLGGGLRVAGADLDVADQVAARVDQRAVGAQRRLGVDDRLEHLVVDDDLLGRLAGDLGVVGGDQGHRLALVADHVDREHRLVLVLEAVALLAGYVVVGEHREHARQSSAPR